MNLWQMIVILVFGFSLLLLGYWGGIHDTLIKDPEHYQEVCADMWPMPKFECKELLK